MIPLATNALTRVEGKCMSPLDDRDTWYGTRIERGDVETHCASVRQCLVT